MAIFKRLQTLARAEMQSRRPKESAVSAWRESAQALRESAHLLQQNDAYLYRELQENRRQQQVLDARAIAALRSQDEDTARRLVTERLRLQQREKAIAQERDQLAQLLVEQEAAVDRMAAHLPPLPDVLPPPLPGYAPPASARTREVAPPMMAPPAFDEDDDHYDDPSATIPMRIPSFYETTSTASHPQAYPQERRDFPPTAAHQAPLTSQDYPQDYPQGGRKDGGFAEDTLATFERMERKVAQLEARGALADALGKAPVGADIGRGELPSYGDEDGSLSPDELYASIDPLADPLVDQFHDLEAKANRATVQNELDALRQRRDRKS